MKRVLLVALLTVLTLSMLSITALADIGNPNGTRKNISAEGEVIDSPAYIVNAKSELGDNYLDVYGFKFSCLNKAALFFSCSVVREEDPFPYPSSICIFTNNEIIKSTLIDMGFVADYWEIVGIPGGSTGTFTLMTSAPIFTSANSGRLLFTEDTAFATGGGTIELGNFVWLDKDGNELAAGTVDDAGANAGANAGDTAGGTAGSPKTSDSMNLTLWFTLGVVSLCGFAVLLVSFRKKEFNS